MSEQVDLIADQFTEMISAEAEIEAARNLAISQALDLKSGQEMVGWTAQVMDIRDETGLNRTHAILVTADIKGVDLPEYPKKQFSFDHVDCPDSLSEDDRTYISQVALDRDAADKARADKLARPGSGDDYHTKSHRPHRFIGAGGATDFHPKSEWAMPPKPPIRLTQAELEAIIDAKEEERRKG